MKVLVDTHAILWWLVDDKRLSRTALRILGDSNHARIVSYASLWEIAIKMSLRKLVVSDLSFAQVVEQLRIYEFRFLPIRLNALERMESLPWHHRDPFDRLLIAQSIEEAVPLMTSDAWAEDYAVKTIW